MRRLFRWVIRIAFGLIIMAIILTVAAILLADTITKEIIVSRLRSQTGMEVKVGSVHLGLFSPTLSVEGVKLYNTADFGGALSLDLPELSLEYDFSALRARQLHLKLLRLNVTELSVVVSKSGRMNFDTWKEKSKEEDKHKSASEKLKFVGIDVLNVTLGKFHVNNKRTGRSEEVNFGNKNQILLNVKTGADLSPLGLTTLLQSESMSSREANMDLNQVLLSLFK
jgi:hypothetical protein